MICMINSDRLSAFNIVRKYAECKINDFIYLFLVRGAVE